MGNVGGGEILVLLLVALIFLGPEKLPEVARQVGKVVGEIRKVTAGFQREMQDAVKMIDDAAKEVTSVPTAPAPAVAAVDAATTEPSASAVEGLLTDPSPDHLVSDSVVPDSVAPTEAAAEPTDTVEHTDTVEPSADPPLPVGAPPFDDTAPVASAAPPLPVDTAHGGDR